jgi:16S rRNA (guanine1207-N2)-methyltransferase
VLDSRFAGRSHYGVEPPAVAFDSAVLFLPKSRELTAYLLNAWRRAWPAASCTWSAKNAAASKGGQAAAGLWQTAQAGQRAPLPAVASHRRQRPEAKPLESLAERFELPLADGPLQVVSLPGVFSHGRLDAAARAVAGAPGRPAQRPFAGLRLRRRRAGCSGQTSLPHSRVTLLDVDAFAAAASRLTLAANGLEGEVISGDGIDAAPMGLNLILSNPPFHRGAYRLPPPRTC